MSKTKFTDGPWHKKGRKVFWQKPDRNLPKDNLFNGLVAICASTEDNPPEVIEEANANATLIAVAPEMYDFIHFFETFAGQAYLRILPDEAGKKIYEEAVRLCKKARGEK